jgi:hypothetical protein
MENIFFSKLLDETHKGMFYHRETFLTNLNDINHIIAEYYDEPEKALYLIDLFYTIIEYGNIITIHSTIADHISIISESIPKYEEYNVEELTLIILSKSLVNPSFNRVLLSIIKKIKSTNQEPEIIFPHMLRKCPYIISWFRSNVPNDFELFCYGYNLVEYTMDEITRYISRIKLFEPSITLNNGDIDINCGKLRLLFRYFKKKNPKISEKTKIIQDNGITREYMSLCDIKIHISLLLSN